jgi:IS30 family transposase
MEKKGFARISYKERVIIEERYCGDVWSMRKIAEKLERPVSAISREIAGKKRKGMGRYRADLAQKKCDEKRKNQGRKAKLSEDTVLLEYVVSKLQIGWSPEQISIRLPIDFNDTEAMNISYEAIYQFIYKQIHRDGYGHVKKGGIDLRSYLPRRHKRRETKGLRKTVKQARIDSLPSIELRPQETHSRTTVGHWEGDTLLSRQSSDRIKSMNELSSGVVFFEKTTDGTSFACNQALIKRLQSVPSKYRKTITQDRGSENMNYQDVEQALSISCYFAHPYASYERGANENANGLLRRFFPKKTDFAKVSSEDLKLVECLINSRPRKRLGGFTPYEVFYQKTGVALDS